MDAGGDFDGFNGMLLVNYRVVQHKFAVRFLEGTAAVLCQQGTQLHAVIAGNLTKFSSLKGDLRIGAADFQIADRYGILRFTEGGQRAALDIDRAIAAAECIVKQQFAAILNTEHADIGARILRRRT